MTSLASRRAAAFAAATASIASALALCASSASAATEDYVPNTRCESSASGWTPSSNATIARATETTTPSTSCVVAPKASGTNTLTARSPLTQTKIAHVGTTVHIASQVKATQAGKTLKMTLEEIAPDGSVAQTFTGQRASATTYGWVGAEFETTVPDSRIRVTYAGTDLTGTNSFRFTNTTVTITPSAVQTQCEAANYAKTGEGRLTFKDDFTGSAVDTTKWRVRDGESLSFDDARIQAKNVTVHDGLLDIAGKRENAAGRQWTTGYLDSIGKFEQRYGRWEVRAKIPTDTTRTKGVWPAFWLRSDAPGEIDIMEAYGSPSDHDNYSPASRYEWTVWKYSNPPENTPNEKLFGAHVPATRPGADFHTYAVQWSPDCMVFSYDGQTTGTVLTSDRPWLATQFNDAYHMRLNMQVGSTYWGHPNDTDTKPLFNYLVDSVKVYTKAN